MICNAFITLTIQKKTNMKNYIFIFITLLILNTAFSQLTISNGNHTLEISGAASTFFNYRSLKENEVDNSKNRFKLRDAQIALDGRVGTDWEYAVKVDFADIAANNANAIIDPENPGLMDANVTYKGWKIFEINAGYGKIKYSRTQLTPIFYTAYWQRAELSRGSIFAMRDIGLTVSKNFWKQRANIFLFGALVIFI